MPQPRPSNHETILKLTQDKDWWAVSDVIDGTAMPRESFNQVVEAMVTDGVLYRRPHKLEKERDSEGKPMYHGWEYKAAFQKTAAVTLDVNPETPTQSVVGAQIDVNESYKEHLRAEPIQKSNHISHRANRKKLPNDRTSTTHKFDIAGTKGYITVGFYPDGCPGEVFVVLSKEGSTIRGLMDTVAKLTSIALQMGVEPRELYDDFVGTRFEPSGLTTNEDIHTTLSLVDYLFRYLAIQSKLVKIEGFYTQKIPKEFRIQVAEDTAILTQEHQLTGTLCPDCDQQLVFEEGCEVCKVCGYSKC